MNDSDPLYLTAEMNEEHCLGAALMLTFLQDLFTLSGRDQFTKEEIVILLDLIGKRDLPTGLVDEVKDACDTLGDET